MPPEHRHDRKVPADPTLDVWAYGATLFECAVGTPPIFSDHATWPPWPSPLPSIGDDFIGLVNACLAIRPDDRPDIDSILSLPCLRLLPDDVADTIRSSKECRGTDLYHAILEDEKERPHKAGCPMMPPSSCSCVSNEPDNVDGEENLKDFLVPLWARRIGISSITVEVAKVVVGIPRDATRSDPEFIDRAWTFFKAETEAGNLGFAAKLSRRDISQPAILVYVEDVRDSVNKDRVISAATAIAERAGFKPHTRGGKPLGAHSWKTDEQTRKGLYSSYAIGKGLMKS